MHQLCARMNSCIVPIPTQGLDSSQLHAMHYNKHLLLAQMDKWHKGNKNWAIAMVQKQDSTAICLDLVPKNIEAVVID